MTLQLHSFVDADHGRCGAIMRDLGRTSMRTRTALRFGPDAPVYLVDTVVEHTGDIFAWTGFRYDAARPGGERVHRQGVWSPDLAGAVPSYAEHLVLLEMLADHTTRREFSVFDEAEPDPVPRPASLARRDAEPVARSDGALAPADRYELTVDGRHTNTHWVADGVVVVSDWSGARSFDVESVADLTAGLDPELTALIETFTR